MKAAMALKGADAQKATEAEAARNFSGVVHLASGYHIECQVVEMPKWTCGARARSPSLAATPEPAFHQEPLGSYPGQRQGQQQSGTHSVVPSEAFKDWCRPP